MARPLRIEFPGAYYHVMSRGNSREDIFRGDKDRVTFLKALESSCEIYEISLLCYVLMPNHFHFVLRTNHANLSQFMKHFLVTYTVRFNRKHGRTGHVFQGRYKSLLVETDEYLLPLTRYVHLNPVRSEEYLEEDVKASKEQLHNYRWSSFPGYCFPHKRAKFTEYVWLLETYFGGDNRTGRERYQRYVYEGIEGVVENPFEKVLYQSILGTNGFVEDLKKRLSGEPDREVPPTRNLRRSLPAQKIMEIVASVCRVEPELLRMRRSAVAIPRQMAMDLCYRYCSVTQKEIGGLFGVDYSTVSQNRKRLAFALESDDHLRKRYKDLEKAILKISK